MSSRKRSYSENQIEKRFMAINDIFKHDRETQLLPNDVKKMLDDYIQWKDYYSQFGNPVNFCRKVLYHIIECMYWSHFEDSNLVELALRFIFELKGNYEGMEAFVCPTERKFPTLRGVAKDDFAQYILKHAYRRKLLLDRYRLLSIIRHIPEPPVLHQMLRFGLLFSCGVHCWNIPEKTYVPNYQLHSILFSYGQIYWKDSKKKFNPNYRLFSIIISILVLNPKLSATENMDNSRRLRYDESVLCCKLLLKDTSMLSIDELHKHLHGAFRYSFMSILQRMECPAKENMVDFIRKFSDNVADDFQNHFCMTLSLKRICRLVIRRELNRNWALPEGIDQLPIPGKIKAYLDI